LKQKMRGTRGKRGTGRGRGGGRGRGAGVATRTIGGLQRVSFAQKCIDQKQLNAVLARVPVVVVGGERGQASLGGGGPEGASQPPAPQGPMGITKDALTAALNQDRVRARAGRTAGSTVRGGGRGGAVAGLGGRAPPLRLFSWNERRDLVEDIGHLDAGAATTAIGMLIAARSGGALPSAPGSLPVRTQQIAGLPPVVLCTQCVLGL
jgi:hypothetical protein